MKGYGVLRDVVRAQSESFLIIGYEPSAMALGGIGRLLLASQQEKRLVFAGEVREGLSRDTAVGLRWLMDRLIVPNSPIELQRKRARWLRPALVADVGFRCWAEDGTVRDAAFAGLRDPAEPRIAALTSIFEEALVPASDLVCDAGSEFGLCVAPRISIEPGGSLVRENSAL